MQHRVVPKKYSYSDIKKYLMFSKSGQEFQAIHSRVLGIPDISYKMFSETDEKVGVYDIHRTFNTFGGRVYPVTQVLFGCTYNKTTKKVYINKGTSSMEEQYHLLKKNGYLVNIPYSLFVVVVGTRKLIWREILTNKEASPDKLTHIYLTRHCKLKAPRAKELVNHHKEHLENLVRVPPHKINLWGTSNIKASAFGEAIKALAQYSGTIPTGLENVNTVEDLETAIELDRVRLASAFEYLKSRKVSYNTLKKELKPLQKLLSNG